MGFVYDGHKTRNEFIEEVADDFIKKLSDKDKEYICDHPFSLEYHFTYCLYIRNHYIYGNMDKFGFQIVPDDFSSSIMDCIIEKISSRDPEGIEPLFLYRLYSHEEFMDLRKKYRKKYGNDPDEIIRKYAEKVSALDYKYEAVDKMFGAKVSIKAENDDDVKKEEVISKIIKEIKDMV